MATVHLDDRLAERFRAAVVKRHGRLYGVFKEEIERAVEDRLHDLGE